MKGNRQYAITALDFRRLALIRQLLGLGFSTEQIKEFVSDRNINKTIAMLNTELSTINEQIQKLKNTKKNIESRLNLINNVMAAPDKEEILEKKYPKRGCIMIREKHLPDRLVDYYLTKYMNKHNNSIGTIGLSDCYTLDLENSNPESSYYRTKNLFFYSADLNKEDCNYYLPEGTYLSVMYHGSLTKTKQFLPKMYAYAASHNFEIAGDPMEFCFIDEYETNVEAEYLIEVELPVR